MKTVKLITRPDDTSLNKTHVICKDIALSICSEIEGGAAIGLTKFFYCREAVIGYFTRFFNKLFDDEYLKTELLYNTNGSLGREDYALYKHKDMPKRKTSVAMHVNIGKKTKEYIDSVDKSARRAIKLLNHYERRNKWLLSKVYKTDHDASKVNVIYLFEGSKWWMTSTHTLSLYLLLIRLGRYEHFDKIKKSTPNSEVLSLLGMIREGQRDEAYVSKRQPKKWNILFDNIKKIYGEGPHEENFSLPTRLDAKTDGITSLCSNIACNKSVRKIFAKLCKAANLR